MKKNPGYALVRQLFRSAGELNLGTRRVKNRFVVVEPALSNLHVSGSFSQSVGAEHNPDHQQRQ